MRSDPWIGLDLTPGWQVYDGCAGSVSRPREVISMACQCGCSTAAPRADQVHGADSECGCTAGPPEGLDVASLARLVRELDQRVKELELAASPRA